MTPTPAKPTTMAAIRRGVGAWRSQTARMIAVQSGVVALMIEPRPAVSVRSAKANRANGAAAMKKPDDDVVAPLGRASPAAAPGRRTGGG